MRDGMRQFVAVTGSGRLASELVKLSDANINIISISKGEMDIRDHVLVGRKIKELAGAGLRFLIHSAALTKPMSIVDTDPLLALDTNILGSLNVGRACYQNKIKFIYISTDFVYNADGNIPYNETSGLFPTNKYAWSKLGGECVAQLIPHSLILRCALTDIPFRHKVAFTDVLKNSITHANAAKIIIQLLNEEGVFNLGGETQSVYDFVRKYQEVEATKDINNMSVSLPLNIDRLSKFLSG